VGGLFLLVRRHASDTVSTELRVSYLQTPHRSSGGGLGSDFYQRL